MFTLNQVSKWHVWRMQTANQHLTPTGSTVVSGRMIWAHSNTLRCGDCSKAVKTLLTYVDLSVEASWPQQSRIQDVRSVSSSQDHHIRGGVKTCRKRWRHLNLMGGWGDSMFHFKNAACLPSISTSSWFRVFSCSLWPPKFPPPLFLPTASISSMKRMQGAFFLAMANMSLTFMRRENSQCLNRVISDGPGSAPGSFTYSGRTDAHKHLEELWAVDCDEGDVGLSSCSFGQQSLSCTRRSGQHGSLR